MAHKELPMIYLARHGETAWSLTGQHTGLTDLPLTETGERNAQKLRGRLRGITFESVFTSPLRRARRPVNKLASDLSLKSIQICSNGTTASMKADEVWRSMLSDRTGSSFATVPRWRIATAGCRASRSRCGSLCARFQGTC
jgi:broad specificity phosphatase PhoE